MISKFSGFSFTLMGILPEIVIFALVFFYSTMSGAEDSLKVKFDLSVRSKFKLTEQLMELTISSYSRFVFLPLPKEKMVRENGCKKFLSYHQAIGDLYTNFVLGADQLGLLYGAFAIDHIFNNGSGVAVFTYSSGKVKAIDFQSMINAIECRYREKYQLKHGDGFFYEQIYCLNFFYKMLHIFSFIDSFLSLNGGLSYKEKIKLSSKMVTIQPLQINLDFSQIYATLI